jgi:hypothetical protein
MELIYITNRYAILEKVKLQKTGKRSAVVWNFREGGGMNR